MCHAEGFQFEAARPFVIGRVVQDFKENDTGLKNIGSRRQQMGDGGVIVQIKVSVGTPVVVSDATWQCLVTHTAPLDKSCETADAPVTGVGACGFDDASWAPTAKYSEAEVRPEQG